MMKKKALSLILCFVMLLSLLPATVFAGEPTTPTATKRVALAAPTGYVMSNGNHTDNTTVVYFGGIPWIVLTMDYDSNGDSTPDGPLLLSEYAYSYGTQWMAYYTNSDRSGTDQAKGYLGSDIRGYINGSNAPAKVGGHGKNTFTAFRPAQYYGDLATTNYYAGFWERVKVTETTPTENTVYFVKDSTKSYIGKGVTFVNEYEFNAAQGGNELYTRSGSSPNYEYNLANSWESGTTYYYETTPYEVADVSDGFNNDITYYTFKKLTAFLQVGGNNASENVAKAYYYAGYSVTELSAAAAGASRTILAGMETGNKTLAGDLGLGNADLAALNGVKAIGLDIKNKYTTTTNDNYQYKDYGGALDEDKLFLLSAKEADTYLPSQTARIAKYGSAGTEAYWWLRTSYSQSYSSYVRNDGLIDNHYPFQSYYGVRPAFNLNLNALIFTSAASESRGKASASACSGAANFVPLATNNDNAGYKLTLKDGTNFGVEAKLLKRNADATYTVAYEAAKLPTDAENVNVSAIITDAAGENVYGYTKLAAVTEDNQSGTATFVLPQGITLDSDHVLKVFEEQCNDWDQNDYASVPAAMKVSTISEITEIATAVTGKTFEAGTDGIANADLTVKAKYSNDYVLTLTADDFTVEKPANYDTTFHIDGTLTGESQSQSVTVKSAEDETKTKTFDITVTGQAQAAPSVGIAASGSDWTLSGMTTDMEYNTTSATEAAGSWTTYASPVVDANKKYYVRYKAHDDLAPGAVRTVTMPASGADTYSVTVNYTKDGSAWTPADKTVDLIGQDTSPSYFDYNGEAIVVNGTYDIYVNNAGSTIPVDTDVDVTVNGATGTATVPFVTMTFDYNVGEENDDEVPVISGVSYDAAAEIAKAETYASNYSLDFTCFLAAGPYTVSAAQNVKAQYTVNAATAAGTLSITTLTNGNAIPTPADVKLTYGGVEYKQSSWEVNNVDISGNAVFDTAYTYKAVFKPAAGYTFDVKPTGLDDSWELVEDKLVKTFSSITAGYPITVNNLPASVNNINYTLDGGNAVTVPATNGTAVISAPAAKQYSVVIKDDKDVTYTGKITASDSGKTVSCVAVATEPAAEELLQQAPVMTMTPDKNSTDVSVSQKSVIVTVDQDITLVGNKALMYVYSSDTNRENDVYTSVYEQTITAAMYDENTRALELKLASFRSGSSYLTTLTSGYSYKLVLAEGTVKSVNGVSQLGNKEFSAYFKPTAYLGFTVQLLKPLNGNVYAYRTGNTSVTTGTGSLTAALGDTVTVYARPDVGYVFDGYTYKWNGNAETQEELVNSHILTVDPDDSSIVHVVADTDAAATLRVVANFKLDTGITDYIVTQYKTSYSVCVGSNVTLSYVVTPGGAALAFESDNNDVAVANGSAVYGMKVGTATITAKDPYDKVVGTWTITVVPAQTDRPQITTNAASNITNTGATLSGTYSGKGFTAREVGIALRTVGGSTQYFKMNSIPADGKVSVDVSGLTPGATYYFSVYVTTANGTTYTDSVYGYEAAANKFTTLSGESNSVIWKSLKSVFSKVVKLISGSQTGTTSFNIFKFLFRVFFKQ